MSSLTERSRLLDAPSSPHSPYSSPSSSGMLLDVESEFLRKGKVYKFTPNSELKQFVLFRTKSKNSDIVTPLCKESILIVLDCDQTWKLIQCRGLTGWISLSEEFRKSKCFKKLSSLRRYEDWRGNNTFLFSGRLILGKDLPLFTLTNAAALFVLTVFYAYMVPVCPWRTVIAILSGIVAIAALGNLWLTALIEPGILPRAPPHIQPNHTLADDTWRYCKICNILRPQQVKHCTACQNCVMGFDHHCPYTSNCVGGRNRRYFVRFLVCATVMLGFVLGVGIANIVNSIAVIKSAISAENSEIAVNMAVKDNIVSFLMSLVAFIFLLFMIPFVFYHLRIISIGETTFEQVKKIYENGTNKNPNDFGIAGNYFHVCCTRIPMSSISNLDEEISAEKYMEENLDGNKFQELLYGANGKRLFQGPKSVYHSMI